MGNTPIEEEIPIEYEDLMYDVQLAIEIYNFLRDEWDTMNGVYIGKNYGNVIELFNMYDVPTEDRLSMLRLLHILDSHRSKLLEEKRPKK